MKLTGVLKKFDHEKGYGFIKPDDRSGDVFLHNQELRESGITGSLPENARLEYDVIQRDKGMRARNIRVIT